MFQRWPKRDPNKHYYLVPNEVFNLGLSSHEIAVYNYLLRCEDRRTYHFKVLIAISRKVW